MLQREANILNRHVRKSAAAVSRMRTILAKTDVGNQIITWQNGQPVLCPARKRPAIRPTINALFVNHLKRPLPISRRPSITEHIFEQASVAQLRPQSHLDIEMMP